MCSVTFSYLAFVMIMGFFLPACQFIPFFDKLQGQLSYLSVLLSNKEGGVIDIV